MNKNRVFSKIFSWMGFGFLLTFITSYVISTTNDFINLLFESKLYLFFAIIEIILVLVLSARVHKFKKTTAGILFMIYSFITGITFSSIFLIYNVSSLIYTFMITAILFMILSIFGKCTKYDLTKMSTYLLISLIGVILMSIINIFIGNSVLDTVLSIVLVIVFCIMTAYDIKKIDRNYQIINSNESYEILFALELYLDFINIFLNLLNLFGKGHD